MNIEKQLKRIDRLVMLTGKQPSVLDICRADFEACLAEMKGQLLYECGTSAFDRPDGIYRDQFEIGTPHGVIRFGCLED